MLDSLLTDSDIRQAAWRLCGEVKAARKLLGLDDDWPASLTESCESLESLLIDRSEFVVEARDPKPNHLETLVLAMPQEKREKFWQQLIEAIKWRGRYAEAGRQIIKAVDLVQECHDVDFEEYT